MKRYKPEWRKTGSKRWLGFPRAGSFGERKLAEKFIKKTRKMFREGKRIGTFRIKIINI